MNRVASESIKKYITETAQKIDNELAAILPNDWDIPPRLRESMTYSLMAGGKRLRSILVLAAAEALGASQEEAFPAACAIELIHTYSLIHDDLPAMDNDDYRRGKLTNHKVFGDAMAILAGDALLTHAFYMLSTVSERFPHVSASTVLMIVKELSLYAGAAGMVGGQVADMSGSQGQTGLAELEYIHTHKTSDLIVFSLRAGGRIAGSSEQQLEALSTFGRSLGLAFQIQDDILDISGDPQKLGKNVNSDTEQNKVTYPYIIGMEASKAKVEELTRTAKEALLKGDIPNPKRLLELADYLMSRES